MRILFRMHRTGILFYMNRTWLVVLAATVAASIPGIISYSFLMGHPGALASLSGTELAGFQLASVADAFRVKSSERTYVSRPFKEDEKHGACTNSYYASLILTERSNGTVRITKMCESTRDTILQWPGIIHQSAGGATTTVITIARPGDSEQATTTSIWLVHTSDTLTITDSVFEQIPVGVVFTRVSPPVTQKPTQPVPAREIDNHKTGSSTQEASASTTPKKETRTP